MASTANSQTLALEDVLKTLQSLPATGPDGFEGLMAEVLYVLTDVPFRLAASGAQHGIDGAGHAVSPGIAFEAKRYDGQIPIDNLVRKIVELNKAQCDLWIIGATTEIRTQQAELLKQTATDYGLPCLILDWSPATLPRLCLACLAAKDRVLAFLKTQCDANSYDAVMAAFNTLRAIAGFSTGADALISEVSRELFTVEFLARRHEDTLRQSFGSKSDARREFRQSITPLDDSQYVLVRDAIVQDMRDQLLQIGVDDYVAVTGVEGVGKSWVVAQTWLAFPSKPLLIWLNAQDVKTGATDEVRSWLEAHLVSVSQRYNRQVDAKRWQRWFEGWQSRSPQNYLNLILVVDGLDERPLEEWPRWIAAVSELLNDKSCRLVVTARTNYFEQHVRWQCTVSSRVVQVPAWQPAEVTEILAQRNIVYTTLHERTRQAFRNPRMLGIALRLLDAAEISGLNDLTPAQLLFAHMRNEDRLGVAQSPVAFARRLQQHAQTLLDRAMDQQTENATFMIDFTDQPALEGQLQSVSEGAFFSQASDEFERYELTDDGLTLALGLSLLHALKLTSPSLADVQTRLRQLLEPIEALDNTVNVVFAALNVAVLDKGSAALVTALSDEFLNTQHIDPEDYDAFARLVDRRIMPFLDLVEIEADRRHELRQLSWLVNALKEASQSAQNVDQVHAKIRTWLTTYSSAVSEFYFPSGDAEQESERRARQEQHVADNLANLTEAERKLLSAMTEVEQPPLRTLSEVCFFLLAGQALTPFAREIVCWRFGVQLNRCPDSRTDGYADLIFYNKRDWSEMREALIHEARWLAEGSEVGKRTAISLLAATGHAEDARKVGDIRARLPQRDLFPGWRLLEDYCAVDPVDPASEKPDNLAATCAKYEAIDLTQVHGGMDRSTEDLFLLKAQCAMARFEPETAIRVIRNYLAQVPTRLGLELRQAIWWLARYSPLATEDDVQALLALLPELPGLADDNEHDWLVGELLFALFPHLEPEEQFSVLKSLRAETPLPLKLEHVAARDDQFISELSMAVQSADHSLVKQLLIYLPALQTPLDTSMRQLLLQLLDFDDNVIRAYALRAVASLDDAELITSVVIERQWSTNREEIRENRLENWYGSMCLVAAVDHHLLDVEEAIPRIVPGAWDVLIEKTAPGQLSMMANQVFQAIKTASGFDLQLPLPPITKDIEEEASIEFRRVTVQTPEPETFAAAVEQINESPSATMTRQERANQQFREFMESLSQNDAQIIADGFSERAIQTLCTNDETWAIECFDFIASLPDKALRGIHPIVLKLAKALSFTDAGKSQILFERADRVTPYIRVVSSRAGIPLATWMLWQSDQQPAIEALQFHRSCQAMTNAALADDVLAAQLSDKTTVLERFIEAMFLSEHPEQKCRALVIAGLMDENAVAADIIARAEDLTGDIGETQEIATVYHDKNRWTKYWFEQMCHAPSNEDYWRASVQFLKIVDTRYLVWHENYTPNDVARRFLPLLHDLLNSRLKKWKEERAKLLFSRRTPENFVSEIYRALDVQTSNNALLNHLP